MKRTLLLGLGSLSLLLAACGSGGGAGSSGGLASKTPKQILSTAVAAATKSGSVHFTLLGKDPTLTGRTGVWTAVLRRIAERPHLGYGYGAFWHDRFGPAMLIRRETHWDVPAAHNGWLEIVLQIGEVGGALVAFYFALTVGALLKRLFARGDGFWSVMYIGAFVVLSFSESVILRQNSLEWILFVATATKLAMEIKAPARLPTPARAGLALVPPLPGPRR